MTKLLLSLHVLVAIVTVGTICVAASMFPRYVRAATARDDPGAGAAPPRPEGGSAAPAPESAAAAPQPGTPPPVTTPPVTTPPATTGPVPAATGPGARDLAIAALLHRVCQGYAVAGLAVPAFGMATAAHMDVLADAWLIASMILTAAAAGLLALAVLPAQRRLLADAAPEGGPGARPADLARLAMSTGVFNVLWAVVVVLMITRPGSTTGA